MDSRNKMIFCPCTIMVHTIPACLNTESMVGEGVVSEAIDKVDHFFHKRLGVPVSWLVCPNSLELFKARFLEWKERYGDEFGIYEPWFYGKELCPEGVQSWVDEMGIERPSVPGGHGFLCWSDVPEGTQLEIIRFLKAKYDKVLQQDTKLMYAACGDAKTVRAMKQAGIEILWGYNWNLYGDLVDATGKGCLSYPFYVNSNHIKAPAEVGDCSLLGVPWGSGDLLNNYCTARSGKVAINNVCLNAHEVANRSGDVPEYEFVENIIAQLAEQAKWNPFAYIPLQIESFWIDENSIFYKQHPMFPSNTTEVFFHLVEAAIRNGARIVTHQEFLDWYRSRFDRTPKMITFHEDQLEGVRFRGKDQDFPPMVLYGDHDRQMIFLKSAGFNPVRTYNYETVVEASDPGMEYPFQCEPKVELKVKAWTTPQIGVTLTQDKAFYSVRDFELTSYDNLPDYACVLWEANIPQYVSADELACSPNISRIELVREKNLAVIFAPLKQGNNLLSIHADDPGEYIRIEEQRFTGRRHEIYIRNEGPAVELSCLNVMLEANLQMGGFWWDGKYHSSLYHYHYSPYNWRTGELILRTAYPLSLSLRQGVTRCSIEVPGRLS